MDFFCNRNIRSEKVSENFNRFLYIYGNNGDGNGTVILIICLKKREVSNTLIERGQADKRAYATNLLVLINYAVGT